MAIDFPDSPSVNDSFEVNGRTYTWNGTQWKRVDAEIASVSPSLTVTGDFTVDTDTLVVDSTNNRVGIGKTNPSVLLDLEHATQANIHVNDSGGTIGGDTNARLSFLAGGGLAGQVGFLDTTDGTMTVQNSVGDIAVEIASAGNVTFDLYDGNVGIGTTSPAHPLDVNGKVIVGGGDNQTPDASGNGHLMIDGAGYTGFNSLDGTAMWVGHNSGSRNLHLATDETARVTVSGGGNVGINDTTPSYTLDVNGDINAQSTLRQAGAPIGMVRTMTVGIGNGVTVVDVPYCFSADYDNYLIQYRVDSATQGTQFSIKLMSGYTLSNSLYNNRLAYNFFSQAGMNTAQSTSHPNFYWLGGMRGGSGSSWHSGNGQFTLLNPHRTTYTVCHSDSYGADTTGGNMTGIHKYQGSYDGFRLLSDIGTISGGRIDVYGYTL